MRNILIKTTLLLAVITLIGAAGCTKKPSPEELGQLDESRKAAESAEKKLSELRAQRSELETTLNQKKQELQKLEEERDAVKAKLGQ